MPFHQFEQEGLKPQFCYEGHHNGFQGGGGTYVLVKGGVAGLWLLKLLMRRWEPEAPR